MEFASSSSSTPAAAEGDAPEAKRTRLEVGSTATPLGHSMRVVAGARRQHLLLQYC